MRLCKCEPNQLERNLGICAATLTCNIQITTQSPSNYQLDTELINDIPGFHHANLREDLHVYFCLSFNDIHLIQPLTSCTKALKATSNLHANCTHNALAEPPETAQMTQTKAIAFHITFIELVNYHSQASFWCLGPLNHWYLVVQFVAILVLFT
jgi:hypothetical protein